MINPYKLMNEAPTVIGMMSVVLSSGGSFEMAVRDVSENGPVLMRTLFNDITMDADCREEPYIKENIKRMLVTLPAEAAPFRRSMSLMMAASESLDLNERRSMMRDAESIVLKGLKEIGDAYSSSLSSPCTLIFGLGIMLPMILISILPMLNLGGQFAVKALDSNVITMVILVFIPAVVASMIVFMRRKNPFIISESSMSDITYLLPMLLTIPLFMIFERNGVERADSIAYSCVVSGVLSSMVMMRKINSESKRRRDEALLMDAMFELGNRLSMGDNFDIALISSFSARKDMAHITEKMKRELVLCRGDVASAIRTVLNPISRFMSDSYCDVFNASNKDIRDAGRLATSIAHQLQDQDSVRKDIGNRLKSMLDMMTGTASVFAPLILAMSVVMLGPISEIVGEVFFDDISTVLSIYLMELTALIAVLSSNLTCESGIVNMEMRFTTMASISLAVFMLCSRISL